MIGIGLLPYIAEHVWISNPRVLESVQTAVIHGIFSRHGKIP